jgi:hypothetical protein
MNRFKMAATILCLCLLTVTFALKVKADDWNKKTVVTFSQPIEIPGGIILPAGTYVFKLMDSYSDRHIVQIFNEDQTHIYATILAIPNYRLQTTDKTVMTFGESAVGVPQAIRAWFYPGANSGEEFVYPKRRAMELAKAANVPILAMPAELESSITKPAKTATDEPVIALKEAPLTAVKPTGEEVDIAQVVTLPPASNQPTRAQDTLLMPPAPMAATGSRDTSDAGNRADRLPQTASLVPLVALLGLLSLGLGAALWALPKSASLKPKA